MTDKNKNNNHLAVYVLLGFIIVLQFYIISQQYAADKKLYDFLSEFETQTQRDHSNLERKILNQQIEILTNYTNGEPLPALK